MAQGRSTEIITMIKWIRTSRLSIKNSLSLLGLRPSGSLVGVTDGAALASDGQGSEQAVSHDSDLLPP